MKLGNTFLFLKRGEFGRILRNFGSIRVTASKNSCFFSVGLRCTQSLVLTSNFQTVAKCRSIYFQKYVKKPQNEESKVTLPHTSLMDLLQKCDSVSEQLEVFHSNVRLEEEDVRQRQSICHHIEKIMREHFPLCSAVLVGSSANGLGSRGSDVDVSLQFSDELTEQISKECTLWHSSLDELLDVKPVDLGKVHRLTAKGQLLLVEKALRRGGIEGPFTLLPGRCRVLNFHVNGFSCDLTINNSSAIHSTNLMNLCEKLDTRVAPVVRAINYWAKGSGLIGGPLKFKSYAFFLLVVYFFQTRKPSLLPPIKELLHRTDSWETTGYFDLDVTKYLQNLRPSENSSSPETLLREFFFFYGNFDFSCVICPWEATLKDRTFLAQEIKKQGFEFNTLCVQDPLNLQWNVTTGVNFKHCKKFLKSVISVCETYHSPLYHNLGNSATQYWGLTCILDPQSMLKDTSDTDHVTLEIPLLCTQSRNVVENFHRTVKLLKHVFEYGLMFECRLLDTNFESLTDLKNANENNSQNICDDMLIDGGKRESANFIEQNGVLENISVSSQSNVFTHYKTNTNSTISLKSCFECVTNNTWSGRSNWYHKALQKKLLDIEREVSMEVLQHTQMKESGLSTFIFECSTICKNNEVLFVIMLKTVDGSKFLPKLAVVLKEYLHKMLVKL